MLIHSHIVYTLALQRQTWVAVKDTIWPTKIKIFIEFLQKKFANLSCNVSCLFVLTEVWPLFSLFN